MLYTIDQIVERIQCAVQACELELKYQARFAEQAQRVIKSVILLVGEELWLTDNLYRRSIKYITDVNVIFQLHAQGTAQYLEYLREELRAGRIWASQPVYTNTPVNDELADEALEDRIHYLYNLHQHRNILHYILACLTWGQFETAKVSLRKLARTNVKPLQQWTAKRVCLSRSFLVQSSFGSGDQIQRLYDIFGATSSVCNSWSIPSAPVTIPLLRKYIKPETDWNKSIDHWSKVRTKSSEYIPSLAATWGT